MYVPMLRHLKTARICCKLPRAVQVAELKCCKDKDEWKKLKKDMDNEWNGGG